jgi:hypothetical protein
MDIDELSTTTKLMIFLFFQNNMQILSSDQNDELPEAAELVRLFKTYSWTRPRRVSSNQHKLS